MELRQLEYVVGAVDAGSFTRAAATLHVAQPSLSQGIARLEAELGTPLFARLGRRVELTAAGEAFVGPARWVLRDVAVVEASVHAVASLEAGTLDLVALPTLAADPLAPLIGVFRQAHPGVMVRVSEPEHAHDVAAHVRDGRAEVGLAELPVSAPDLVAAPLLDQELVVILPPGDPRRSLTIRALADEPLLASPAGTSTRRILTDAFAAANVEPHIAVESGQREAILPLVLAGAGVALVPLGLAHAAASQGASIAHVDPVLRRTIGTIVRAAPLSPAARRFRDLANQLTGATLP
jgi:LysR family transcriptional regulator, carnitine catabolism transcriptional activator